MNVYLFLPVLTQKEAGYRLSPTSGPLLNSLRDTLERFSYGHHGEVVALVIRIPPSPPPKSTGRGGGGRARATCSVVTERADTLAQW